MIVVLASRGRGSWFERVRRRLRELGTPREPAIERSLDPETPAVDLIDQGDELVCLVDLPGFDPDDIDVSIDDGDLRIEAATDAGPRPGTYLKQERQANRMSREVSLPGDVEVRSVGTRYRRGVLQITVQVAATIDVES